MAAIALVLEDVAIASPTRRVAEDSSLDQGDREDEDEEDHPDRGRESELRVADRRSIDEQDDRRQRVVRLAPLSAGDQCLVEQLEAADEQQRRYEEVGRPEERERDAPERLPGTGAVDGSGLVDLLADRLQERQVEQHDRARRGP